MSVSKYASKKSRKRQTAVSLRAPDSPPVSLLSNAPVAVSANGVQQLPVPCMRPRASQRSARAWWSESTRSCTWCSSSRCGGHVLPATRAHAVLGKGMPGPEGEGEAGAGA
eukprot:2673938-Pleurochrysis_carterae.AAC.1